MSARFPKRVYPVLGRSLVVGENRIKPVATFIKNAASTFLFGTANNMQLANVFVGFHPDLVITDFDPWCAQYAAMFDLPLYTVDNNHAATMLKHDDALTQFDPGAYRNVQIITTLIAPIADHHFVMSFFPARVTNARTSLHAPIVREEIATMIPEQRDHVLVYSTMHPATILDAVWGVGPVRVYGAKGIDTPTERSGVQFFPTSETAFNEDLRTCKAIIAGAGFSLMTEAIALGKPMLAIPIGGHFEQQMNAYYLEKLGLGARSDELTRHAVHTFLKALPDYQPTTVAAALPNDIIHAVDHAIAAAPLVPKQIDYGRMQ
jgi:uncharacterized protein (TIGR00661 family)